MKLIFLSNPFGKYIYFLSFSHCAIYDERRIAEIIPLFRHTPIKTNMLYEWISLKSRIIYVILESLRNKRFSTITRTTNFASTRKNGKTMRCHLDENHLFSIDTIDYLIKQSIYFLISCDRKNLPQKVSIKTY